MCSFLEKHLSVDPTSTLERMFRSAIDPSEDVVLTPTASISSFEGSDSHVSGTPQHSNRGIKVFSSLSSESDGDGSDESSGAVVEHASKPLYQDKESAQNLTRRPLLLTRAPQKQHHDKPIKPMPSLLSDRPSAHESNSEEVSIPALSASTTTSPLLVVPCGSSMEDNDDVSSVQESGESSETNVTSTKRRRHCLGCIVS